MTSSTKVDIDSVESMAHLGLVVLEAVGFVHHQAGPVNGAQNRLVDGDQLVRGEQHVELDGRVFLRRPREKIEKISVCMCV